MKQPPSYLHELRSTPILPVFKSTDIYIWHGLIDLCAACGIRILEFRDGREARGLKLFSRLVEYAARYPQFQIGVSTIKNITTCETFLRAGAAFISSPFVNVHLAKLCFRHQRGWIPGCSSLEDVRQAVENGAQVVSVLPGTLANGFLDSIKKEFENIAFIPSSGNELNDRKVAEWLAAGALCIRKEQTIFPTALTSIRDWPGIDRLVRRELESIRRQCSEMAGA